MPTVLYCFSRREKCPLKKPNFPMRKVSRIVEILVWPKTSKEGQTYMVDLNKIALSFGGTHIELSFLQLAIITSSKYNAAFSIILIIQHRDYNAKPIRDVNSKRWGWGKENLLIFGKLTQKNTLRMKFWQNASVNCLLLNYRT